MITRPLDLASKLRPEPRSFDFLFLVNGGLIVLFFYLFGSQFVLAPGLGVNFQMPEIVGARAGAVQTTHRLTINPSGFIIIEDGLADLERTAKWLGDKAKEAAREKRQPSLLIIASQAVPNGKVLEIANAARAAGFVKVQWAGEEPAAVKP